MFGNTISKITFSSNEIYYISPLYKKNKVDPVDKIRNDKKSLKFIKTQNINNTKMKEIFKDINLSESSYYIYDERDLKFISDYIFLGNYYDDFS